MHRSRAPFIVVVLLVVQSLLFPWNPVYAVPECEAGAVWWEAGARCSQQHCPEGTGRNYDGDCKCDPETFTESRSPLGQVLLGCVEKKPSSAGAAAEPGNASPTPAVDPKTVVVVLPRVPPCTTARDPNTFVEIADYSNPNTKDTKIARQAPDQTLSVAGALEDVDPGETIIMPDIPGLSTQVHIGSTIVHLESNSRFTLPCGDDVHHMRGRGFFDVHLQQGETFELEGANAVGGVKGTKFYFESLDNKDTFLLVKGELAIRSTHSAEILTLRAGNAAHISSSGAISSGKLTPEEAATIEMYTRRERKNWIYSPRMIVGILALLAVIGYVISRKKVTTT